MASYDIMHHIVYTDNSRDEEDNIKIYASIYDPKHGDEKKLLPIETVEEWTLVENLLANIQTMVKMGKFANLDGENNESYCDQD